MNRAEQRRLARRKDRDVVLAYCRPDETAGQFCDNIGDLLLWDNHPVHGKKRIAARICLASGPRIAEARNILVREFLKTDAQYLWMLDADMGIAKETLYRMLEVVEQDDEPVVLGALCFAGGRTAFPYPVIYSEPKPGEFEAVLDYPDNSLIKVAATGAACLLIDRRVLEVLGEKRKDEAYPWFEDYAIGKKQYGEDVMFCRRLREAGFDLFVHTGIEIGHMKVMPLHSALYKLLRSLPPYEAEQYMKSHRRAMGMTVAD